MDRETFDALTSIAAIFSAVGISVVIATKYSFFAGAAALVVFVIGFRFFLSREKAE